jgi:hypothetical protein
LAINSWWWVVGSSGSGSSGSGRFAEMKLGTPQEMVLISFGIKDNLVSAGLEFKDF